MPERQCLVLFFSDFLGRGCDVSDEAEQDFQLVLVIDNVPQVMVDCTGNAGLKGKVSGGIFSFIFNYPQKWSLCTFS